MERDLLKKAATFFARESDRDAALAAIAEKVPGAPLSRGQVELIETDTVVGVGVPSFDALGISPKPLEPTLEEILAIEGFDVRAANDARAALAIARDFAPDVAFVDLNMPEMNGFDATAHIRRREQLTV